MKRLLMVAILMVSGVNAQIIAAWDVIGVDLDSGIGVETNEFPYTFMATTNGFAIADARLTLGSGVNPSTYASQYGFKIPASEVVVSLADALDSEHYLQFSLSVADGYLMNLQSLKIYGHSSELGCSNVVVMSSVDGFTDGKEIANAFPANRTGGFDTDASGFGAPIDLSANQYQNLTGTVSFRLYGWNSVNGSSTTYIRNLTGYDLIVNGTINELSSDELELSLSSSNGMMHVIAVFNETATTNYILQRCDNLASNDWNTASAPFADSTNWVLETTNNSGFFRVIAE